MHFDSTGAGEPTVVFTHGVAASGQTWAAQVAALAPRHRVLTWDLRGLGRSDPAPAPCTVAELAADLVRVFDRAGVARAVIVGHSAGGVVAMRAAPRRDPLPGAHDRR